MRIITTTKELVAFCEVAKHHPYVTLDTEFLREKTYWSKLCLIQMALSGENGEAVLIDPIENNDLSLEPLYDLFRNESVVKVFHAARQDLEIFFVEAKVLPKPLFDTQLAAMVCGFGDQVSYEKLVYKIVKKNLDKSSRFSDWSHRPLSDAQKSYALADVTHLRVIYEWLRAELDKNGRASWVAEELAILLAPETYQMVPDNAWLRLKTRSSSGRFLATAKELARFREEYAQQHNVPRNRVMKDEALLELASIRPQSLEELGRSRLLMREGKKPEIAEGILAAIRIGLNVNPDDFPQKKAGFPPKKEVNSAVAELLRVLLKTKSESLGVAAKLISSTSDLDALAAGTCNVQALQGWRKEVFGNDALKLCAGRLALSAKGNDVVVVEL